MNAQPGERPRRLLVGLGNAYRGDDAVGPVVVSEVASRLKGQEQSVRVVDREEPASLMHLLDGVDVCVVVDAIRSGRRPGDVVVTDLGSATSATAGSSTTWSGMEGTHGMGLAAVVELARTLDLLPARLVLVGIEAERFDMGSEVSASVRDAVSRAADTVLDALALTSPVSAGDSTS